MTDTPVIFLSDSDLAGQHGETFPQADIQARLYGWVRACLDDGVQHLDTMVVTAPDKLKVEFGCYEAIADEIEIVVQRIWTDMARERLRAGL